MRIFEIYCLALLLGGGLLNVTAAAAEPELTPGLLAEYEDDTHQIQVRVPEPHFRLSDGESVHPQINGRNFSAVYRGVLRVERGDTYVLSGNAVIEIDGKAVGGKPVQLAAGDHPLVVRYNGKGAGRLQLRWKASFFAEEPLPPDALFHQPPATKVFEDQQKIDEGRFLYASHGCASCHQPAGGVKLSHRGPDLSNAAQRLNADWLHNWLEDPRQHRPQTTMPRPQVNAQQRSDLVAFIMTLQESAAVHEEGPQDETSVQHGQELFQRTGCVKCHGETNPLNNVAAKYKSVSALARFIADPLKTSPHGRMPELFNAKTEMKEVRQIADYLFTLHDNKQAAAEEEAPQGDAARGAKVFASAGCANCHTARRNDGRVTSTLDAPAFGQLPGLPLRSAWNFEETLNDSQGGTTGRAASKASYAAGATALGEGKAYSLGGKNFVELNHFPRPDVMTLAAWVRTTQGGTILAWGRAGGKTRGSREWRMNIGQDGRNSLTYGEYNSDGGWKPVTVKPAGVNLVDGKWHHVAMVRKGVKIQHYIDGKPQGRTGVAQPGGGDYTDRLLIGALPLQQQPSNRFKGDIDDLSIWETALSPAQIQQLAGGVSAAELARPTGKPPAAFSTTGGCLKEKPPATTPDYRFTDTQREALQLFLTTVQPGKLTYDAPAMQQTLAIRSFNCTACHEWNGAGRQDAIAVDDEGRIVRVEIAPLLTGVGDKLTTQRLSDVLVGKQRNRPWLKLRMPHFGSQVAHLPPTFAKTSGATEADPAPVFDLAQATAGLKTIGVQRGQVACINCHNYRGLNQQKDGVVPAPDLAMAGRTVRSEWFQRWMHNPTRLQPGTSMPQFFGTLSPADRDAKIAELWAALYHQERLPLPKGLIGSQTQGTQILVDSKPVVFRVATKTAAGQINRAINVGLPGDLNYTFDPETCKLRFVWSGKFIDAAPAWNGRGGNPVTAKGRTLHVADAAFPLRVKAEDATPELRFRGYRLIEGHPLFRYEVDGVLVEHRVDIGENLTHRFTVYDPPASVRFIGQEGVQHASSTGAWQRNVLTVPQAAKVEFTVTVPFENGK